LDFSRGTIVLMRVYHGRTRGRAQSQEAEEPRTYDNVLEKTRDILRLDNGTAATYSRLMRCFLLLNRLEKARAILREAGEESKLYLAVCQRIRTCLAEDRDKSKIIAYELLAP
jgi:pentatricopeptide repeat protein